MTEFWFIMEERVGYKIESMPYSVADQGDVVTAFFCRALPTCFRHGNTVWKRFDRLSEAGVSEAVFDTLAAISPSAPDPDV